MCLNIKQHPNIKEKTNTAQGVGKEKIKSKCVVDMDDHRSMTARTRTEHGNTRKDEKS